MGHIDGERAFADPRLAARTVEKADRPRFDAEVPADEFAKDSTRSDEECALAVGAQPQRALGFIVAQVPTKSAQTGNLDLERRRPDVHGAFVELERARFNRVHRGARQGRGRASPRKSSERRRGRRNGSRGRSAG